MKKLLLILLCLPFVGLGQTFGSISSFTISSVNPTNTSTPTPVEQDLQMILFFESSGDALFTGPAATDVATYMGGSPNGVWFGFTFGGQPNLSDSATLADFKYWMDWPGHQTGTVNAPAAILVDIPQISGGVDSFGNAIDQFIFETTEVPSGSFTVNNNVQIAPIVPHSLLDNSGMIYSTIGFDYNSVPSNTVSNTTSTGSNRADDIVYTGSVWTNTTYRLTTNGGPLNRNISIGDNNNNFYFRGGNVTSVGIEEHTTNKELLNVTDLLGRETKDLKNQPLLYIYNDGTVEKRIVIE